MTNFLCRNIVYVWGYCMQICHSFGSKWGLKILETLALTIGTFIFACGKFNFVQNMFFRSKLPTQIVTDVSHESKVLAFIL